MLEGGRASNGGAVKSCACPDCFALECAYGDWCSACYANCRGPYRALRRLVSRFFRWLARKTA